MLTRPRGDGSNETWVGDKSTKSDGRGREDDVRIVNGAVQDV